MDYFINMDEKRNIAIDFVKGISVLAMLLHHSINYFPIEYPLIKYVRFVSSAFIFISGFIVTHFYLKKYSSTDNKIYIRLFIRALKLIIIFTLLNIAIEILFKNNFNFKMINWNAFLNYLYTIYISGNSQMAAFDLLIPIAYVLICTGMMIYIFRKKINLLKYIVLALFLYCSIQFYDNNGGYYLRYMIIGLIGAVFGLLPDNKINIIPKYWILTLIIYCFYLISLLKIKQYYPIYTFIIIINLFAFYTFGIKIKNPNFIITRIIILGKYSLLSYLIQIVVLQALKKISLPISLQLNKMIFALIIATLITYLFIKLTDLLRKKLFVIENIYKLIFA